MIMNGTKKLFLTLAVILATGGALSAQQGGGVKMSILTYAPVDLPEDFQGFYQSGGDISSFTAGSTSVGVPVIYEGPRLFVLRASEEDFGPPKEGEKPSPPLATVELPASSDNALIMALPKEGGSGVRLVAYDISTKTMRKGDYMAFNFATQPVAVRMGEQNFTLKPGKDTHVHDSKWRKEVLALPMQIGIRDEDDEGQIKIVYSRYWEHYPQNRNLMFFFNGRHPRRPIVFSCFNAYEPLADKGE